VILLERRECVLPFCVEPFMKCAIALKMKKNSSIAVPLANAQFLTWTQVKLSGVRRDLAAEAIIF